jgi:hypothetical protein
MGSLAFLLYLSLHTGHWNFDFFSICDVSYNILIINFIYSF